MNRKSPSSRSPWKKHGYKPGQVINETVKLIEPDFSGVKEKVRCQCLDCGEEYVAEHSNLRRGMKHRCSPWTKSGYEPGQVIDGSVQLIGPDLTGKQEKARCLCLGCGEEYVTAYIRLQTGQYHRCSPWGKSGYKPGQVINGSVQLIEPDLTGRQEKAKCLCLSCGEEYVAGYGQLQAGHAHRCSPWKKYGYKPGQVINESVRLIGQHFSGNHEKVKCLCLSCGEEYVSGHRELRRGCQHRCSPWKKNGYEPGQVINESVQLIEPDFSCREERALCLCLVCGEEYTAFYPSLQTGARHQCSPWKKHGYKTGQVINTSVELIEPECSGVQEAAKCRCLSCGEEYVASYTQLRSGSQHKCVRSVDYSGFTTDEHRVVEKVWNDESLHWNVEHIPSGNVELWRHSTVSISLVGDLGRISRDCAIAIRQAARYGKHSQILEDIGTSVDEVQLFLPDSQHSEGYHMGHIIPKSRFFTPRGVVASYHPKNLRWIEPKENMSLGAAVWAEKLDCPSAAEYARLLADLWLEDRAKHYPGQEAVCDWITYLR